MTASSITIEKKKLEERARQGEGNPSVELGEGLIMWHTPQTPLRKFRYSVLVRGTMIPLSEIEANNYQKKRGLHLSAKLA